jgi:lipopolysaccharide export system permease protein
MTVFRATFKEMLAPFALSLFVLSMLLLLDQTYRLISLLVNNRLRLSELGLMLAYLVPEILTITLPLAVVAGVTLTVVRQSTESELICHRASGRSMWSYAAPYVAFGVLTTLLTAAVTLWVRPVAHRRYIELQAEMIRYRAEEKMIPGEFNFDFGGKVMRIGAKTSGREFSSIFIADRALTPYSAVVTAERGALDVIQNTKRVVLRLENGQFYLTDPDAAVVRTMDFDRLNYRLEFQPAEHMEANLRWGIPTGELARQVIGQPDTGKAYLSSLLELFYRLTSPLACLALTLAALPMSIHDPRSGRTGSMARAMAPVVAYYLVWVTCKDLVQSRRAPVHLLWVPPLLIAVWGIMRLWLINNESVVPFRRWRLRWRRG